MTTIPATLNDGGLSHRKNQNSLRAALRAAFENQGFRTVPASLSLMQRPPMGPGEPHAMVCLRCTGASAKEMRKARPRCSIHIRACDWRELRAAEEAHMVVGAGSDTFFVIPIADLAAAPRAANSSEQHTWKLSLSRDRKTGLLETTSFRYAAKDFGTLINVLSEPFQLQADLRCHARVQSDVVLCAWRMTPHPVIYVPSGDRGAVEERCEGRIPLASNPPVAAGPDAAKFVDVVLASPTGDFLECIEVCTTPTHRDAAVHLHHIENWCTSNPPRVARQYTIVAPFHLHKAIWREVTAFSCCDMYSRLRLIDQATVAAWQRARVAWPRETGQDTSATSSLPGGSSECPAVSEHTALAGGNIPDDREEL